MTSSETRVVILRIEPTAYTLSLLQAVRREWDGPIDVLFASRGLTQKWEVGLEHGSLQFLPLGRKKAFAAIARAIRGPQPTLLHTAGWGSFASLAAMAAARAMRTPIIIDGDTWSHPSGRARKYVKRLLLPHLLRQAAFFAPAGRRQCEFLQELGVPSSKMAPVNQTVDVAGIQSSLASDKEGSLRFRQEHGVSADQLVVLFVGRLLESKGIRDLMKAWRQVTSAGVNAKLIFVGSGELRGFVERNCCDSVGYAGRLSGSCLWSAYAAADLFVAPSWSETWGLTVNEAMSAGAPVLMTSNFGCIGDLATNGETAIIVPPQDPQRLADEMIRLLLSPVLRQELSARALELISGWHVEHQAKRLAEIWRGIAQGVT